MGEGMNLLPEDMIFNGWHLLALVIILIGVVTFACTVYDEFKGD